MVPMTNAAYKIFASEAVVSRLRQLIAGDAGASAAAATAAAAAAVDATAAAAAAAAVDATPATDDGADSSRLRFGDFPMETRLYRPGSNMAWHQDVALYVQPQYELIYTAGRCRLTLSNPS
jgi:hypothetical protein